MRFLFVVAISLILGLQPAVAQETDDSRVVKDPSRLVTDVVAQIVAGDIAAFEDVLNRYARRNPSEIEALISGTRSLIHGRKPVYVDSIEERRIGTAFYESKKGAFYGEDTFLFIRLTLAKVENGWILLSFSLDTDPKGYLYE